MGWYKIGEIAKNVGISSFSLKYYEKKGLLQPKVDEHSGYRYYDVPDLGELLWIHQMRNWNFTVKEIQHLQKTTDLDETLSMMERKIQENEALAARLFKTNRCLTHRIQWAKRAKKMSNQWEIAVIPSFLFLPHCRAEVLEPEAPLDTVQNWVQERIDTYMGIQIPMDKVDSRSPKDAYWGFLLFDNDTEEDAPSDVSKTYRFLGKECLVYYYSQPVASHLSPAVIAPALDALRREGLTLQGDVYGLYLSEILQGNERYENYVLFLPIKKD